MQGPGLPARIYAGEHSSPLQVCFQFGFIKARDDVGIVPYNPVETFWKNRRDGKPIPYKNFQNVPEYFVGAGSSGPHLCGRTQFAPTGLFSVWFYQSAGRCGHRPLQSCRNVLEKSVGWETHPLQKFSKRSGIFCRGRVSRPASMRANTVRPYRSVFSLVLSRLNRLTRARKHGMINLYEKRGEGKSTLLADAQRVPGWCKGTGRRRGRWFRSGASEAFV